MDWKKFGHCLLYPHLAVIICLLPISVTLLVLSLIYLSPESIIAIVTYLLAFYLLMVICFRIPRVIKFCQTLKKENKYIQKWLSDVHLRMNVSLYGALIWNVMFAILQLILGFINHSFWFLSMFFYYVILGVMRFFLLKHTRNYQPKEDMQMETKKSILCGWLLLFMNLTLAVIVVFVILLNDTFQHHMITTIAIAFFTFLTLTFAIINLVRYRKYQSPIYSAAKSISLIAVCVSLLTMETTMLATFGAIESQLFKQIILSISGVAVIGFAITMAIIMIVKGYKQLIKINLPSKK